MQVLHFLWSVGSHVRHKGWQETHLFKIISIENPGLHTQIPLFRVKWRDSSQKMQVPGVSMLLHKAQLSGGWHVFMLQTAPTVSSV